MYASDSQMNRMMESCARKMNIKGHWVGLKNERKFIYGPTDIEGHIGTDGRRYLLDFQRTYPPEHPASEHPRRSMLYNLLRPEFVTKYNKPLSSDALSKFALV